MKKVLIVDNSSYMRMLVKKVIEKEERYEILEAASKAETMYTFKQESPEIVILDLNLGQTPMDGLEVLKEMVELKPETVIIIASAVGDDIAKEECIALGAKGYLTKPINTKLLIQTLAQYE
jgi:two-component system chemotaxis response regulator CheY